jgi:hypothetical protein
MKSTKKVFPHGIEYHNEQGKRHRTDGPAVEYNNGSKSWWINGERHREDGPSIDYYNGDKSWYLNGFKYTEDEWKQELAKIKLKRILDL